MALSSGFEGAAVPAALTAAALVGSYYCGVRGLENYCVSGALGERACGLYGIVLAVIGALSVSGYVLALGNFGAIVGGARDVCAMAGQETALSQEGGALAAAGRSGTAAAGGYACAASVLAAVLLFFAYMGETARLTGLPFETVNFAGVEGLAGGLLGAALLSAFCAFCFRLPAVPGMRVGVVIRRFLLAASPALILPAAALAFRRSGQGPDMLSAMLISVVVCGGIVSASLCNAAAIFENPRIREGSSAMNALLKFLPAMALALAALFV
jgi:Na+/H+-translocating membrane pyrophosphatase